MGIKKFKKKSTKKKKKIILNFFQEMKILSRKTKSLERVFLQAKQFASANVTKIRNEDQHIKEILKNKVDT